MRVGKALKYTAFVLVVLWGLAFGAFAGGYALEDPGGWTGVGIVASYAAPILLLSVLAVWRPSWASPVLAVLLIVVLGIAVADAFGIGIDRNVLGPVGAISGLVVAVPLGFLGLKRAKLAGLMLVFLSLVSYGVLLARIAAVSPEGPPPGSVLGGSAGVGLLPELLVGALFLVAGFLLKEPWLRGSDVDRPKVEPVPTARRAAAK